MEEQKNVKPQAGYETTDEPFADENNRVAAETGCRPEQSEPVTATIRTIIEKENEKESRLKELYEWVQAIAVAVVLALIINQFVFAMVQVSGSSMVPTLHDKERLVITKLFYQPKAKDIVVIKSYALGKHIIKRVIAVPGDTVDIHPDTGDVLVNGEVLDEPYIQEKLRSAGHALSYPFEVPEGYVFVMGDNRNNSQDSRSLGLIAYEDVVGRAALRVTPFSSFGTLYKGIDKTAE